MQRFENKILGYVEGLNQRLVQPLFGLTKLIQESDPKKIADRFAISLNTSNFIHKIRTNTAINKILPISDLSSSVLQIQENRNYKEFLEYLNNYLKPRVENLSLPEAGSYARWFTASVVREQFSRINPKKTRYEDNFLLMIAYDTFSLGADF